MMCSAVCLGRFMVKSPAQSGRLRTLIHPGPVSGVHVTNTAGPRPQRRSPSGLQWCGPALSRWRKPPNGNDQEGVPLEQAMAEPSAARAEAQVSRETPSATSGTSALQISAQIPIAAGRPVAVDWPGLIRRYQQHKLRSGSGDSGVVAGWAPMGNAGRSWLLCWADVEAAPRPSPRCVAGGPDQPGERCRQRSDLSAAAPLSHLRAAGRPEGPGID